VVSSSVQKVIEKVDLAGHNLLVAALARHYYCGLLVSPILQFIKSGDTD
jgi:hypothetical protein